MIRNRIPIMICYFAVAVLAARALAAQEAAEQAPPAPPAPPAPAAPAPVAPVPPAPPTFDFSFDHDLGPDFDAQMAQFAAEMAQFGSEMAELQRNEIRPQIDLQLSKIRPQIDLQIAEANAQLAKIQPFALFQRRGSSDDRLYERGQNALDHNQWNEALNDFTEVSSRGAQRADGALYWKAYTLNKLSRRDEALAAIAELRKTYASSRWLDDAKALEIEIKQASGQNVSPESQPDEELKLMALNALVNSDPDRAFPLLENLLKSSQSPRLKERALFVLAQSNTPRARQLLEQIAKGNGNPDLQLKAIQYLGTIERKQGSSQLLFDIYNSSTDESVKRTVLRAWLSSGDTDHLLQAVRAEKSPELKAEGIRYLGGKAETGDALVAIWGMEQDQQVKRAILDSLTGQRNAKALVELARKERDTEMKRQIVQRISTMKSKEATDYLMELLK